MKFFLRIFGIVLLFLATVFFFEGTIIESALLSGFLIAGVVCIASSEIINKLENLESLSFSPVEDKESHKEFANKKIQKGEKAKLHPLDNSKKPMTDEQKEMLRQLREEYSQGMLSDNEYFKRLSAINEKD